MSARPSVLCFLQKGKALAAHAGFVDTFNWLVSFCDNLKGEGEIDSGKSDLRVDRNQDDYPVIRGGGKGDGSVDNVSVGNNNVGEIEIKDFHDPSIHEDVTLGLSLADMLTMSDESAGSDESTGECETVERFVPPTDPSLPQTPPSLKYRPHGKLITGTNTNLVFTHNNDGTVSIDIYYK